MEGSKRFFLLVLGLCLVTGFVNSSRSFGNDGNSRYNDVTSQLAKQRGERASLMQQLEAAADAAQKEQIQTDLEKVLSALGKSEAEFSVMYKDYLNAIAGKSADFENERQIMQKALEDATKKHADAFGKIESANEAEENGQLYKELEELAIEMDTIEKEYTALIELHHQQQERIAEEQKQFDKLKEDLTEKLRTAQNLHSKALAAMAAATDKSDGKQPSTPLEKVINGIKNTVNKLSTNSESANQKFSGLSNAQRRLRVLYDKLIAEGQFPRGVPLNDLEDALVITKMDGQATLDDQINKRNALLEELSKKEFADFTEDDIEAVHRMNQGVSVADMFMQEIANRGAYLNALKQVSDLMKKAVTSEEIFIDLANLN